MDDVSYSASDRLRPPPEGAGLSTLLNGVSNGIMLGVIPGGAMELYKQLVSKSAASLHALKHTRLTLAGGGIGCVLGAVYGMNEGKQVEQYRNAVYQELSHLRHQADSQQTELERLQAKDQSAPDKGISR